MSVKLSTLASVGRIPTWVNLAARFSSIPCAVGVEIHTDNDRDPPKASDFEANLKFLRNKLVPESLIRVLDSTSDVESAVKVFKWVSLQRAFHHTVGTYSTMILKLGLAGQIQEIDGFCRSMITDRCIGVEAVDALTSLVDQFVKHSKLDEAMRVLANMNLGDCKPSIDVFNVVLGALLKEKRELRDIMFVYKEMVKAGRVPTVETLNYLLEALLEADLVDSALHQYRRMDKKGCAPNCRTFEILVKKLLAKNRIDEACMVLHEMLELGTELDLRFYSRVIPLVLSKNKLEVGMCLFKKMKASNLPPEPVIYNSVVHHLCNNCLVDEAKDILESMIDCGVAPSDDAFEDIVNAFCTSWQLDEAIEFLEDKQVSATSAYNRLLEGCCGAGKVLLAKELFDKMSHRNIVDCCTWNILIRWFCEHSRLREALGFLGRMSVSGFIPNSLTLSALAVGCCKLGKYDNAFEIFNHVCAKSWILDSLSYSKLVEGLCQEGKTLEAAEVFNYMAESGVPLESCSYGKLIRGIYEQRGVNEALKVRILALKCGTVCTSEAYTVILHGLARKCSAKSVLAMYSLMLVEGCIIGVEAYCILVKTMILQNRMKDAASLFSQMVSEGSLPEMAILSELVSHFSNFFQLNMISDAIDVVVSNYEILDSDTYNFLINGFWKEGNKSKAQQLLDLMLEKGWVPDARTHGLVIGSEAGEEVGCRNLASDYSTMRDSISDILSESLDDD